MVLAPVAGYLIFRYLISAIRYQNFARLNLSSFTCFMNFSTLVLDKICTSSNAKKLDLHLCAVPIERLSSHVNILKALTAFSNRFRLPYWFKLDLVQRFI